MTEVMDAASLLSPQRLDVLSKLDLAEAILLDEARPWASLIYRNTLSAFNPFHDFNENGYKNSLKDYEINFHKLFASLQSKGFDEAVSRIPITHLGIADGAHRLAAALTLGLKPSIEKVDDSRSQDYGYKKMMLAGIPRAQIEYMVWRYVQLRQSTRALVLTNVGTGIFRLVLDNLVRNMKIGEIYSSELSLSENGKRRLIELSYGHLEWWKPELIDPMYAERHLGTKQRTYAIYIDSTGDDQFRELKLKLRYLVKKKIGFDRQIHGTDSHFETLLLAESLLNANSRHFMNHSPLGAEQRIGAILASAVKPSDFASNSSWLIDGSAVLELYGIRPARDIDFVSTDPSFAPEGFDRHNKEYVDHAASVPEVLHDPRKHFRFRGVKYLALSEVIAQKVGRLDGKDKHDIYLTGANLKSAAKVPSITQNSLKPWQWKLRVLVGRYFEKVIRLLPQRVENRLRLALRRLAKVLFRD